MIPSEFQSPLNDCGVRWRRWTDSIVNMHLFQRIDIAVIYGIFIHKLSCSIAQSWMAKCDILSAPFFPRSGYLAASSDITGVVLNGWFIKRNENLFPIFCSCRSYMDRKTLSRCSCRINRRRQGLYLFNIAMWQINIETPLSLTNDTLAIRDDLLEVYVILTEFRYVLNMHHTFVRICISGLPTHLKQQEKGDISMHDFDLHNPS